jgi:hypothetical protein
MKVMVMDHRTLAGSMASRVTKLKGILKEWRNKMKSERAKVLRRRNKIERFTRKGSHKESLENALKR